MNTECLLCIFVCLFAKLIAEKSYYDVMGISRNASEDEVKKAYRNLARKLHPDKNLNRTTGAEIEFKELGEAYETLSNPVKRRDYDRKLMAQASRRNTATKQQPQPSAPADYSNRAVPKRGRLISVTIVLHTSKPREAPTGTLEFDLIQEGKVLETLSSSIDNVKFRDDNPSVGSAGGIVKSEHFSSDFNEVTIRYKAPVSSAAVLNLARFSIGDAPMWTTLYQFVADDDNGLVMHDKDQHTWKVDPNPDPKHRNCGTAVGKTKCKLLVPEVINFSFDD